MLANLFSAIRLTLLLAATASPAPGAEPDDAPVLLGRLRPAAILGVGPAWKAERAAYRPDADAIRTIASNRIRATLDVYLGTWCPDSRREVPRLLRILETASPRGLRVRFYGIDRTKEHPARLVRRVALERVPTLVLTAAGREVGRIVETPRGPLERDLADLIARLAPGAPARGDSGDPR
ncbi:MAG: TlpA family protein disulfide reductase [Candidatus Polarisedimenticolia bacterium]